MKINTLKLSLLVLLLVSLNSFAQKGKSATSFSSKINATSNRSPKGIIRCVSTEYEAELKEKNPQRATTEQFESWLSEKIADAKAKNGNSTSSTTTVITIPVVVHVISDGDAVGVSENIADAQVRSQITVLNQDYRRLLGSPGYNTNAIGADVEVEFCLAQRDPNGEATNGIDRVNLGQASWGENAIETTLKPNTVWDSSQYLNLWTCRFGGDLDGVLGYAQFPNNSGLGGIDANNGTASTDGVIINFDCFGSSTLYPGGTYQSDYDKGRTATHEIGHYLGLRHIWGDNSSCTVNSTDSNKDYCPDTPAASAANYTCATINSCSASPGNDMIENYMDYTNDTCMNIFTVNQKARIVAVLQNATRRASLLTSVACTAPETLGLDAKIEVADNTTCSGSYSPVVTITNRGTTDITSLEFTYSVDNVNPQTYTWSGLLFSGVSEEIDLNAITVAAGSHTFYTTITTVNGIADDNATNNSKSQAFSISPNYVTTNVVYTLQRDKYASETTWNLKNSAGAVVYSGGPYQDASTLPAVITQTFVVNADECYTFTINDSYGDGICCSSQGGSGYYNLKTSSGTVMVSGTNFGSSASTKFAVNQALATSDFGTYLNNITLYPNPAKNVLNISIQGDTTLPDTFVIYNSLGQTIQSTKVNSVSNLTVNTSALSNGIYFVKINKDNESKTLRFIKN